MAAKGGALHICVYVEVFLGSLGMVVAVAAMICMGLFYSGVLEALSIDSAISQWLHPGLLHPSPLINDTLLLLIFCVSHSLLARKWMKNLFSFLSPSFYRHLYVFQTCLSLFLICYGWSPQPTPTLWDVQSPPLRLILYGVCAFGVVLNVMAFSYLSSFDFFGIGEPLQKITGKRSERGSLINTGLYGLVRHPMYTSVLISVWCHPTMTLSRLLVAGVVLLYVLIAAPLFEEPDLIQEFGEEYRQYMKTTPMLLPLPTRLWSGRGTDPAAAKDK